MARVHINDFKTFQNFFKAKLANFQIPKTLKGIFIHILTLHKDRKTLFSMLYFIIFFGGLCSIS